MFVILCEYVRMSKEVRLFMHGLFMVHTTLYSLYIYVACDNSNITLVTQFLIFNCIARFRKISVNIIVYLGCGFWALNGKSLT